MHYLCNYEEDIIPTRILRHGQLSDGEGIDRVIRGDCGGADSRLAIASQEGIEGNTCYYRPRAARLASGQQLRLFPRSAVAQVVGIPALLGNPYFMMTEFLKERVGEHEYIT